MITLEPKFYQKVREPLFVNTLSGCFKDVSQEKALQHGSIRGRFTRRRFCTRRQLCIRYRFIRGRSIDLSRHRRLVTVLTCYCAKKHLKSLFYN